MPLLSTFLGHTDPASTYWYLQAVPELMELVSGRLEQILRGALMTALAPTLQAFFTERLSQRGASPHTVAAYRDTFGCCCASPDQQTGKQPFKLDIDELDAPLVGGVPRPPGTRARQQPAHPQRPPRRDPFVLPLRGVAPPGTRALIARVLAIPPKRVERDHRLLPDGPRSTRCSPRPTAPPASAGATTPAAERRADRHARLRADRADHRRRRPRAGATCTAWQGPQTPQSR